MSFNFLSPHDLQITLQLIIAAVLGGLIGFERETHGKEAGLRTYSLVSVGSCLLMIVSVEMAYQFKDMGADPGRIAAQVVSGIGFLGAGAIIRFQGRKAEGEIRGLTTAAGIWATAGIGLACGTGLYYPAVLATAVTLVILMVFSKLDRFLGGQDN